MYPHQKFKSTSGLYKTDGQDVWLCLFDRTSEARTVTHACDRRGNTLHVCPNEGARESSCDRWSSAVSSLGYELEETFLLSTPDTRLETSRFHLHTLPLPESILNYFKLQGYSSTLIWNKATRPVPEPTEPPTQSMSGALSTELKQLGR